MEIKKIFIDMDGVLADFDMGALELCNFHNLSQNEERPEGFDDDLWAHIKTVDHFYYKLKPIEGAVEMFKEIYAKYGNKVEILTGIPKPERGIVTSEADKKQWVKEYLSETVVVNTVARKDKIKHCEGKDCILIDDYQKDINEWENEGGTGIFFENPKQAMELLRDIEENL